MSLIVVKPLSQRAGISPAAIPHNTKVQYPAGLQGLMCSMLTMPHITHIKKRMDAQMRVMPSKKPYSEIVCLVDDDPLVLRSTSLLLASDGFDVRRFENGEDFIAYVASHDPLIRFQTPSERMAYENNLSH